MNNKKGFTLIEILTVVLIIGILSGVALPQYRRVMQKAYAAQAVTMMRVIYDSSERLAVEFGYKDYTAFAAEHAAEAKFSRMDMFNAETMPANCAYADSETSVSCPTHDTLKAYKYKADVTSGTTHYVAAKKIGDPYQNTVLLFNRSNGQIYCQGTQVACDVFGLTKVDTSISF